MSGVFYLIHILYFIVHRLNAERFLSSIFSYIGHQGVLYGFLYLGHQMYIVHKEHFEEVLADIRTPTQRILL